MIYVYVRALAKKTKNSQILLSDIAQIYDSEKKSIQDIENIVVGEADTKMTVVSIIDIIKKLDENDIKAKIVGEQSCAITIEAAMPKRTIFYYFRIAAVLALLFAGGMATIINYNSDVEMGKVHKTLSTIATGNENFEKWITVVYSLGIGIGVLFFSNIGKKTGPSIFQIQQNNLKKQTIDFQKTLAQEESQKTHK